MQMLKANILGENRIPYRAHFIILKIKNISLNLYTYKSIEYLKSLYVKYLGLSNP